MEELFMNIPQSVERIYVFPRQISDNIHEDSMAKFLSGYKKYSEFVNTGGSINDFIGDLINEGKITHEGLNDFLFNELFY
jgi:hypothetical protein